MVNSLRHESIFSPSDFGDRRVDVIGVGATGSRIAFDLAKLGVEQLHVWDDDIVEEHNIANQIYGEDHIGLTKVEALHDIILNNTDTGIVIHKEKYNNQNGFAEIVFLLTDTMSSRKQIWDDHLKMNPDVKLLIETRMDADQGIIHTLSPCEIKHIERWEKTLYNGKKLVKDSEAEASQCGGRTSIGATASLISGFAIWQFMKWFSSKESFDDVENILIFGTRPLAVSSFNF